jgi:hypothetical protein
MLHKKSTAAWAQFGGRKIYYRSLWERNFARWLEFQKQSGMIKDWLHEPQTFWFTEIKRGVRSYLPDFKVTNLEGDHYWVEVKGFYDSKSLTKIKRFNKYYPNESLRLIDAKWFASNNQKMRLIIPSWEFGGI